VVTDESAAALGQDRGTAGETCALLLATVGRGTSDSEVVRKHAENDRGAATAERIANQERQRVERSEVIQCGQVSVVRQVGDEKQAKQTSETSKRAAMRPAGGYVDLNLTRGGRQTHGFRTEMKLKSEMQAQ
jgi:hypothetical protein